MQEQQNESQVLTTPDNIFDDLSNEDNEPIIVAFSIALSASCINLIAGLLFNSLICLLFYKKKRLRTSVNLLTANLCAADMLNICLSLPIVLTLLTQRVRHHSGWSSKFLLHSDHVTVLCSTFDFVFFTTGCAELVTVVAIALERLQAIASPFSGAKQKHRIRFVLWLSWAVGLTHGTVACVLSNKGPFRDVFCSVRTITTTTHAYGIYIFLPFVSVCTVIIVIFYISVTVLMTSRSRMKNNLIGKPNKVKQGKANMKDSNTDLSFHQKKLQSTFEVKPSESPHNLLTVPITSKAHKTGLKHANTKPNNIQTISAHSVVHPMPDSIVPPGTVDICEMDGHIFKADKPTDATVGSVCMLNTKNKEAGKKRVEIRAAKRTTAVIIMFFVCWSPLPIVFLSECFISSTIPRTHVLYYLFSVTVALIGSTLNPFIYTVVNKQFRTEFRLLFNKIKRRLALCRRRN